MGLSLELACVLALVGGCYEPSFDRCAVTCATTDVCPSGLSCIDGFCLAAGESAAACRSAGNPDAAVNAADAAPSGVMIAFAAGPFDMGCTPGTDPGCDVDEGPVHTVNLSAFEIDSTEVRQSEYLECVDDGTCTEPADAPDPPGLEWDPMNKPNHPVYHVTWFMADTYCRYAGKRLPTEAEWERAARGTQRREYPWGPEAPECFRAQHLDCTADDGPVPVGSSNAGATPEGVFDMAGNVFEWVGDFYSPDYYSQTEGATNPQGPADIDGRKVGRGGGYRTNGDEFFRGAFRSKFAADDDPNTYGFRCARSM